MEKKKTWNKKVSKNKERGKKKKKRKEHKKKKTAQIVMAVLFLCSKTCMHNSQRIQVDKGEPITGQSKSHF